MNQKNVKISNQFKSYSRNSKSVFSRCRKQSIQEHNNNTSIQQKLNRIDTDKAITRKTVQKKKVRNKSDSQ